MKAQFASIEALFSLLLALSILSFSVYCLNSLNASMGKNSDMASSGMASYDFISQLLANASERECIYAHGPSACNIPYTYYRTIYGLGMFRAVRLSNVSMGNYFTRCFSYFTVNATGYICIEAD